MPGSPSSPSSPSSAGAAAARSDATAVQAAADEPLSPQSPQADGTEAPPVKVEKGAMKDKLKKMRSKKVGKAIGLMKVSTSLIQMKGYSDAAVHISNFWTVKKGHSLGAWLHHFDRDHNGTIDFEEWCRGMKELDYKGDIVKPWKEMDTDGSGELTIDEIDIQAGDLWLNFRQFCAQVFKSGKDMIHCISLTEGGNGHTCTKPAFIQQLNELGWTKGYEDTLYHCLDKGDDGYLCVKNMKWLDIEKKKQRRKEVAKEIAEKSLAVRAQAKLIAAHALADFKFFLKKRYGNPFKAWRRALDLDGSMSVQRAELFKACHDAGWQGDVRALWRALDKDGSGSTGLEELDPHCAKVLARFKSWAQAKFGESSVDIFRGLDRIKAKKLKMREFIASLQHYNYEGDYHSYKQLFTWIDWQGNHYLTEKDLACFDEWKPPAWLLAQQNKDAAQAFKDVLHAKYGHFLKAWRHCLDTDNSNRVSWHEFECAAKKINFNGDLAGAWLAFDDDLSGFITLKEIDEEAYGSLLEFRTWADTEFGGVRSAFKVLDGDGSGELTFREFRRAVRDYGFGGGGDSGTGDARKLFNSLDADGAGLISHNEIAFLDDWEAAIDTNGVEGLSMSTAKNSHHLGEELIEYSTENPGPGHYEIPSGFAAGPRIPIAKHLGTFSLRKRPPTKNTRGDLIFTQFGFKRAAPKGDTRDMGPDPSYDCPRINGPAFGWGRTKHNRIPKYLPNKASEAGEESQTTPGPGSYDLRQQTAQNAPMFSITPRRPTSLHPSHRGFAKRSMIIRF